MKDAFAAWRHRPWVWIAPLAFVALNVLLIVFFQTAFSGQVAALERSYDRQAQVLETLRAERENATRFIERLDLQESSSETLYASHFATEGERFTTVLRVVRSLAREAGMEPKSYSYSDRSVDAHGLTRLGITFAVEGTYEQLRRFINLLELTDQFLTLEEVKLGEAKGSRGGTTDPRLTISLNLSTIFAQGDSPTPRKPSLASSGDASTAAGDTAAEDET